MALISKDQFLESLNNQFNTKIVEPTIALIEEIFNNALSDSSQYVLDKDPHFSYVIVESNISKFLKEDALLGLVKNMDRLSKGPEFLTFLKQRFIEKGWHDIRDLKIFSLKDRVVFRMVVSFKE